MTLCYVLYDTYSKSFLLSYIQTYSDIFTSCSDIFSYILAYLESYVTLAYSKPSHIENPSILRTQDILRTLSRQILAYSERCATVDIGNLSIFRISAYLGPKAYSESSLFRHIQVYSGIFNNDITFFFSF